MNNVEMIKGVAERTGMTQVAVRSVIEAYSDLAVDALGRGEDVILSGLGRLTSVQVSERKARNPRTGEPVKIAAHRKPKLKPSRDLQDAVNRR